MTGTSSQNKSTVPPTVGRDEPWWEPDGTPTVSGLHPHYALWNHEGRKWDVLRPGFLDRLSALERVAEAARDLTARQVGLYSLRHEDDAMVASADPYLAASIAALAALDEVKP